MVPDENALNVQKTLEEVQRLNDIEDPEETPFKSKYEARKLLEKCRDQLIVRLDANKTEELEEEIAAVDQLLGKNFIDTEENHRGEEALKRSSEVWERRPRRHSAGLIENHNILGALWSNRNNYDKALEHLHKAKGLYEEHGGADVERDEKEKDKIASEHTQTVFYMAQVYGNTGEKETAAKYCLITMRRQLETKVFIPEEWAENGVQMSGYFLGARRYADAEHSLRAAARVLDGAARPEAGSDREELHQTVRAKVAWAYGKLYTAALKDAADETAKRQEPRPATADPKTVSPDALFFEDLSAASALVATAHAVRSFDQARPLFLEGLRQLGEAHKFYVLDGYVSDHYAINEDISSLYRSLIFFEPDPDRKCKLLKRRIDLMEPLAKELNPKVFVVIFKQITFELGELYREMWDSKAAQAEAGEKDANPKKLFELASKGAHYYLAFTEAYNEPGKEEPGEMDEDNTKWFLTALFSRARLLSKMEHPNPVVTRDNLVASLNTYQRVLQFAASRQVAIMREELSICHQMVELLPLKIANLSRRV